MVHLSIPQTEDLSIAKLSIFDHLCQPNLISTSLLVHQLNSVTLPMAVFTKLIG